MAKKDMQPGKKKNLRVLLLLVSVIAEVVSFRKQRPRYILKIPLTQRVGKVTYTVESAVEPVTFNKRKDAEAFKKLLAISVHGYKSDIVRREITDEGFYL